eukprot:2354233-Rhodomonas_salina.1
MGSRYEWLLSYAPATPSPVLTYAKSGTDLRVCSYQAIARRFATYSGSLLYTSPCSSSALVLPPLSPYACPVLICAYAPTRGLDDVEKKTDLG